MPRTPHTRTLLDDDGELHEYSLMQHPAREGLELQARIVAILGGGAVRLIGAVADSLPSLIALARDLAPDLKRAHTEEAPPKKAPSEEAPPEVAPPEDGEDAELVLNLNGAELGAALESTIQQLFLQGGSKLALDLLKHTTRDGRRLDAMEFDRAYQGNYGELYEALWFATSANFAGVFKRLPFNPGSLLTLMQQQ